MKKNMKLNLVLLCLLGMVFSVQGAQEQKASLACSSSCSSLYSDEDLQDLSAKKIDASEPLFFDKEKKTYSLRSDVMRPKSSTTGDVMTPKPPKTGHGAKTIHGRIFASNFREQEAISSSPCSSVSSGQEDSGDDFMSPLATRVCVGRDSLEPDDLPVNGVVVPVSAPVPALNNGVMIPKPPKKVNQATYVQGAIAVEDGYNNDVKVGGKGATGSLGSQQSNKLQLNVNNLLRLGTDKPLFGSCDYFKQGQPMTLATQEQRVGYKSDISAAIGIITSKILDRIEQGQVAGNLDLFKDTQFLKSLKVLAFLTKDDEIVDICVGNDDQSGILSKIDNERSLSKSPQSDVQRLLLRIHKNGDHVNHAFLNFDYEIHVSHKK